jgi:hypothetical protein
MSLDITGIGGYQQAISSLQAARATQPASASEPESTSWSGADDAVSVELSGIPSEVSDAINNAAGVYDQLAAGGQHVSFSTDPQTGGFSARLQDADGTTRALSPSDVLDIASGEDID